MEINNQNSASSDGDIATSAAETTALGAISTAATPVTTGHAPEPSLGGDQSVNYGEAANEGADRATTSNSYGTRLSDGVQTTGDQNANNAGAVQIGGSDVGANDE